MVNRMIRRMLSLGSLLLAVAFVVGACGGDEEKTPSQPTATARPVQLTATPQVTQTRATPTPAPNKFGGIVRMGKPCEIKTLEPLYADACMQNMSWPLYDPLISRGDTQATLEEFQPGLAKSWDVSSDGMQITLHLRDDVKWHDGQAFTSADAEYTFDAMNNPPQGHVSQYKARLADVTSVTAPDKNTLVIKTKRPTASIVESISIVRMVPKHRYPAERPFINKALGTGPFILDQLSADGSTLKERKNPNYWRPNEPKLDGLEFTFLSDPAIQLSSLRTKRIDGWMSDFSKGQVTSLKEELRLQVKIFPKLQYAVVWLRLGLGKPWDDIRVRQAMSLAIDRPGHIKAAWLDTDETSQFALPGPWALPQSEVQQQPGWGADYAANVTKAKQLLKDAGFANGFNVEIKFPLTGNWEPSSQTIQQMFRQIGINMTLRGQEIAATLAALRSGEFELINYPNVPALSDPNDILFPFTTANSYVKSGYSNTNVDEAYQKAVGTFDQAERKRLINSIERELFASMPALPTVSRSGTMGSWDYVKDFAPHGLWFHSGTWQFRNMWIDQSLK